MITHLKFLIFTLVLLITASCENKLKTQLELERTNQASALLLESRVFAAGETPYSKLFSIYERIGRTLAADELKPVEKLATELSEEAKAPQKDGKHQDLLAKITAAASALAKEKEDPTIRKAFGTVSEPTIALYRVSGSQAFDLYQCPMAPGYQFWLQPKGEKIANPYFGKKMLRCGVKKDRS